MPYKQSEAAAVVLCVAMSETERLIYGCCGAAGLFLSQLRCAAAYLRLRLQLMDDWSRQPTALRQEGREEHEGRERVAASQWLNTSLQTEDTLPNQKHHRWIKRNMPCCRLWIISKLDEQLYFGGSRLQRELCLLHQRFSVNSAFYHPYGTVPAMLFRVV